MRAIYAASLDAEQPLNGLVVGDLDPPPVPAEWVPVSVRAAALNHHDLWALRGIALRREQLPMILGTDCAGVDERGREVVIHAVIGDPRGGDESLDPDRTLLSERYPGTLAEQVWVPRRNIIELPEGFSLRDAACLPTSWLTAWAMLTRHGRVERGGALLVQGGGGGVATAATLLGLELGARVYVTSRSAAKRERLRELGASPLEPGERLPERVDVVIETVGVATLEHSLKACKPGARVVIAGATSGFAATIDLRRLYFLQISLLGATMGTAEELAALVNFLDRTGVRPIIDSVYPFGEARSAFEHLASGDVFGKIVLEVE